MPTVITPLRSSNAYFGIGKQSVGGTAVAPSQFPRWLDGTNFSIELAEEQIREGDTSRHLSQIIKNKQMVKAKLVCYPRPTEMGFLDQAAMGTASDTLTTASVVTTLSGATTAGATSISVASNTGLTGSGTIALTIGAGTASEEIALFDIPATGAGPYVINVDASYNGGALKLAHANSSTVAAAYKHVLVDTTDGDYFTVEVNAGGSSGLTLRIRDCKVDTIKRSCAAGKALKYEVDFVGIASSTNSISTPTYEAHQIYLMTQGAWTLDGSTTGDALNVETFDITQKNSVDVGIQTEQLTLAALIFGMIEVDIAFTLVFTTSNRVYQTYFGSSSGTTDSQTLGTGALILTFTAADTLQSVTYTIGTLVYTKLGLPTMKADGKHLTLQVTAFATSNMGANASIMSVTHNNNRATAY